MMGRRSRCYSTFVMGPEMWIVTTKIGSVAVSHGQGFEKE